MGVEGLCNKERDKARMDCIHSAVNDHAFSDTTSPNYEDTSVREEIIISKPGIYTISFYYHKLSCGTMCAIACCKCGKQHMYVCCSYPLGKRVTHTTNGVHINVLSKMHTNGYRGIIV